MYEELVGKTVAGILLDDSDGEEFYGLAFSDGSFAWVLQDPEGNAPGFLEVQTATE